ncbi:MAG: hypothetical protein KGM98_05960, partial [Bacteroidota bacterium]|nr:hypothetical protein [Bacteroidota bacterium]
ENKITSNSSSEVMGQTMESNADVTTVYHIEVQNQQNKQYHMKNSIASIKMTMTSPAQSVSFDSDKKDDLDGPIGSAVKPYINQPQDVVMDETGNLIQNTDSSQASDSASQSENLLKQLGDPKQQGYGASMAFMTVPKNASVGTKWQDSTSNEGVTKVTQYEIKDLSGTVATVSMTGTEDRDTKMEMQGMEISTKTKGQFTGTGTVELSTGVVKQNTFTENAEGTVSVMGQDIPTKIKVTSTTSVSPL